MAVFRFLSDGKRMWLVLMAVKERKIWEWQVSSRAVQQRGGLCHAEQVSRLWGVGAAVGHFGVEML